MIGQSAAMREIFAALEKIAASDLTVMITGETGTGKELVARGIHNASPRRDKPFVVLDCGSIPKDLIESTLFGHEKGSFTGAVGQHRGCFEQANGVSYDRFAQEDGTFLDCYAHGSTGSFLSLEYCYDRRHLMRSRTNGLADGYPKHAVYDHDRLGRLTCDALQVPASCGDPLGSCPVSGPELKFAATYTEADNRDWVEFRNADVL